MALQLEKEFATGAVGNYWKISDMNCNPISKTLVIQISCFKNQAAKEAGKPSMSTETMVFSDATDLCEGPYPAAQLLLDNVLTVGYTLVKTQSYFEGAQDV